MQKESKPWYKKWWLLSLITFFILFIATPSKSEKDSGEKQNNNQTQRQENTEEKTTEIEKNDEQTTLEPENIEVLNYEIVYKIDDRRYDGGISYFVLIDEVDTSNDSFKEDIKTMLKDFVEKEGNKVSIDFLDNRETLDLMHKSHYGISKLGRVLNTEEIENIGEHLIASYSGDLETGLYLNTLDFFPGTFKDNPKVGKYVETIEYNPSK